MPATLGIIILCAVLMGASVWSTLEWYNFTNKKQARREKTLKEGRQKNE